MWTPYRQIVEFCRKPETGNRQDTESAKKNRQDLSILPVYVRQIVESDHLSDRKPMIAAIKLQTNKGKVIGATAANRKAIPPIQHTPIRLAIRI